MSSYSLSVLKRSVPKALAFAFGLRLHSKTQHSKTRVLGRRFPSGTPQESLRFRDLRGKTLAFKKRIAISSCVLEASLGARARVQVLCVQKTRRFAFAFLCPLSLFFRNSCVLTVIFQIPSFCSSFSDCPLSWPMQQTLMDFLEGLGHNQEDYEETYGVAHS